MRDPRPHRAEVPQGYTCIPVGAWVGDQQGWEGKVEHDTRMAVHQQPPGN